MRQLFAGKRRVACYLCGSVGFALASVVLFMALGRTVLEATLLNPIFLSGAGLAFVVSVMQLKGKQRE